MIETIIEAEQSVIALTSNEVFIHCVPLKEETRELYMRRMVHQGLITKEAASKMDWFDQCKLCYNYYTDIEFKHMQINEEIEHGA